MLCAKEAVQGGSANLEAMMMKTWTSLLLCALLAACASAPRPEALAPLFHDHLFAPPTVAVGADDLFTLSPAMRQHLATEIAAAVRAKGPQRGLLDGLYARGRLLLEYDAALTRTAAEAFDARAGNCLSLVIMTAAFARELDLKLRFQQVLVDEAFGRRGDLVFSIGHVNLGLGHVPRNAPFFGIAPDWLTVDFLPPRDARQLRYEIIDEATVRAMFMNNRAAEALGRGETDDAYWWARAAVGADPRFLPAHNTLGVIYQRRGHLAQAEQVLRQVLARKADDLNTMSNLVGVLREQGRSEESRQLALRLKQLQPVPPFAYFDQGLQAMREGDVRKARELFEREVDRDPDYHEFHFWLAAAYFKLGNVTQARRHLERARDSSPTRKDEALYAGKLDRLKAQLLR